MQYYCEVEQVISVPKEVFVPKPKVDSAVLNLRIRKEKPVTLTDEKAFCMYKIRLRAEEKDSAQFSYGVCGLSKEKVGQVLSGSGIDPMRRAETLSIEEFASMSNKVAGIS